MHFGIGRDVPNTLEQIGQRLGLSRERVRQLESIALAKIAASPVCRELAGTARAGRRRASAPKSRPEPALAPPLQFPLDPESRPPARPGRRGIGAAVPATPLSILRGTA
jgi:hypothetical protein